MVMKAGSYKQRNIIFVTMISTSGAMWLLHALKYYKKDLSFDPERKVIEKYLGGFSSLSSRLFHQTFSA